MNVTIILKKLVHKQHLTSEETSFLLSEMMQGKVSETVISSLLTAFSMKGETVEEIVGFIQTMRNNMVNLDVKDVIDVCGTGGDGKQTFNISTAVGFVVAGAGVKIAKHGNRASSSLCGSADVLEKLGVNIFLNTEQAKKVLEKVGMVFLFAPVFHPAVKSVSLVRKALGIPTVFNYLGPFCNPARVTRQLIGVPSVTIAEKLIQVAQSLDYHHLIIATSEDGLDEISILKKSYIYELKEGKISRWIIDPKKYGFHDADVSVQGGDAEMNAEIIKNILEGLNGQHRDIVLLNSAVAMYIAGKAETIEDGLALARNSIDSGNAKKVLENLIKETQIYVNE